MSTAFFFNLPYYGHVNPAVPIAEQLVRRGERVLFYAPERFRPVIERAGAIFEPFPFEETDKGTLLNMVTWQLQVTERCMPKLLSDYESEHPSYVVLDYTCLWGRTFARHLGLPAVVLYTTFPSAFDERPVIRATLQEICRAPRLLRTLAAFRGVDRRVARKCGVPRLRWPMSLLRWGGGDLNLVLTSPDMEPRAGQLGRHYQFVGPCLRPRGYTSGEPLPDLGDGPLVYVSLGTFWNDRPRFYETCVEAYRNAPFQVLISAGDCATESCFRRLPRHIHVRSHVDQIEALSRASAFLSHGGMNSICEAMCAGLPLLLFPQINDQFALARYVADNGAGILLHPAELSPDKLYRATYDVLHDARMRERSRQLGEGLRGLGGAARAADLVLAMSRHLAGSSRGKDPSRSALATGAARPISSAAAASVASGEHIT